MLIAFNLAKAALFKGNLDAFARNETYRALLPSLNLSHFDLVTVVEEQTALLYCPLLR